MDSVLRMNETEISRTLRCPRMALQLDVAEHVTASSHSLRLRCALWDSDAGWSQAQRRRRAPLVGQHGE